MTDQLVFDSGELQVLTQALYEQLDGMLSERLRLMRVVEQRDGDEVSEAIFLAEASDTYAHYKAIRDRSRSEMATGEQVRKMLADHLALARHSERVLAKIAPAVFKFYARDRRARLAEREQLRLSMISSQQDRLKRAQAAAAKRAARAAAQVPA